MKKNYCFFIFAIENGGKKKCRSSRLKALLPHGFDAVADIVEDMAALGAAAGREETTDDAGNMAADVKLLRVVNADALHAKTEPADTRKDDRLALRQSMFQNTLQFGHHTDDGTFAETAVAAGFGGYIVEGHLALADCFCKILAIRTAALDIVFD